MQVTRALLSVSDKTGIVDFARELANVVLLYYPLAALTNSSRTMVFLYKKLLTTQVFQK